MWHELFRPNKQPVSKPTKTFHQISVYWLCQHKRQTLITVVYERIRKGQCKRCIDLDNIPIFGRNASISCYLKVIKSKKTVKQMHFTKKNISISYKFPILSKDYSNLKVLSIWSKIFQHFNFSFFVPIKFGSWSYKFTTLDTSFCLYSLFSLTTLRIFPIFAWIQRIIGHIIWARIYGGGFTQTFLISDLVLQDTKEIFYNCYQNYLGHL